jgi:hypothetical protein
LTKPPSKTALVGRARSVRRWIGLFQTFQQAYVQEKHPEWRKSSLNVLLAARAELDELIEKARLL